MTIVEYIKRKNKILKEITGIILVPESQIKEIPAIKLDIDRYDDSGICPYCLVYLDHSKEYELEPCKGCPMKEQGNDCLNKELQSTYRQIINKLNTAIYAVSAIRNLATEYNSQF